MSNQVLTPPPGIDTSKIDTDNLADLSAPLLWSNHEAHGSFWRSLAESVRELFAPGRKPALDLESKPVPVADPFHVEPIWVGIRDHFRTVFFPGKVPPLQLESQPIAKPDLLANPGGRRSHLISVAVHAVILAALAVLIFWPTRPARVTKSSPPSNFDVTPFMPLGTSPQTSSGGGGGGSHDVLHAAVGKLPKIAKTQFVPPEEIIRNPKPKLVVEPTIVMPKNIQLPNNTMPNLGDPLTAVKGPASNGTGASGGIGSGHSGGVGSGSGAGVGPGQGGGYGGGLYQIGNGVLPPKLIYSVDPQFTDQARMAKFQGECGVEVIVDAKGIPHDPRIVRHLGMGLDQKAIEAVQQYRFKPATFHGRPVPVRLVVIVDFHIY